MIRPDTTYGTTTFVVCVVAIPIDRDHLFGRKFEHQALRGQVVLPLLPIQLHSVNHFRIPVKPQMDRCGTI